MVWKYKITAWAAVAVLFISIMQYSVQCLGIVDNQEFGSGIAYGALYIVWGIMLIVLSIATMVIYYAEAGAIWPILFIFMAFTIVTGIIILTTGALVVDVVNKEETGIPISESTGYAFERMPHVSLIFTGIALSTTTVAAI